MSPPETAAVPDLPDAGALWGLLAEFDTVDTVLAAAEKVRDAGFAQLGRARADPDPRPRRGDGHPHAARCRRWCWGGVAGAARGPAAAVVDQRASTTRS